MIDHKDTLDQYLNSTMLKLLDGFYALFNHHGERVAIEGSFLENFPKHITALLAQAKPSNQNTLDYDYIIKDYPKQTLYIYQLKNNDKLSYMVIGLRDKMGNNELTPSLPIGILKINSRWEVYHTNEYAQALLGLGEDEILGTQWTSLLSIETIADIHAYFAHNKSVYGAYKTIVENISPLGKKRILSLALSRTDNMIENAFSYVLILQDITKEHEANEQILFNATHDNLTKLIKRSTLIEEIHKSYKDKSLKNCA